MAKPENSVVKVARDTGSNTETYGVRGSGQTWQAYFGMSIDDEDLLVAAKREPVSNRIVFQVAHDVFDNWFEVEVAGEKPDPKFNEAVQKVLEDLNAKAVFTQMAVFERLWGWALIGLSYVDYGVGVSAPVESPREIRELLVFGPQNFSVQSSDEDDDVSSPRFGLPVYYTVRRGSSGSQEKLHYSRVIHFATRLLDHAYIGMSTLEPVYDDMTILRNIRWGMGQTLFRYGSGFPDVTITGAKKKDLDDLEASQQFKSLQARTYFLHNDKTTLDFKGAAGSALNPEPYYLAIMENISAGCGIPLALLRGAQAGALTGSEVNEREYFKLISDAQSRYEPGVRDLIDRLIECGMIRYKWNVNRGYRIKWLGGFEMNEKDKADVELRLAQAMSWSTDWMTVDEVRSKQDLDPLPDAEQGKIVLGLEGLKQKSRADKPVKSLGVPSLGAGAGDSAVSADGVSSSSLSGWDRLVMRFRRRRA